MGNRGIASEKEAKNDLKVLQFSPSKCNSWNNSMPKKKKGARRVYQTFVISLSTSCTLKSVLVIRDQKSPRLSLDVCPMVLLIGRNGSHQRKSRSIISKQRKNLRIAFWFRLMKSLIFFFQYKLWRRSQYFFWYRQCSYNLSFFSLLSFICLSFVCYVQVYPNGHSEIILGKAIKQHNLPRDKNVILTKVCVVLSLIVSSILIPWLI